MTAREAGVERLALPDMERRIANMIRYGSVVEIDYAKKRVRVQSGEIKTAWLPWSAGRSGAGKRRWDPPEVGEQVALLCPTGDLRQAGILPGFYSDANDAPSADPNKDLVEYSDGTVIEYDRGTHTLSATIGETAVTANQSMVFLQAGGSSLKISAAGVEIVGNLIHTGGNGTSTGTITAAVDVVGGGKSLKTHTHSGVQSGPGNTGAPN